MHSDLCEQMYKMCTISTLIEHELNQSHTHCPLSGDILLGFAHGCCFTVALLLFLNTMVLLNKGHCFDAIDGRKYDILCSLMRVYTYCFMCANKN